MKRLFISALVYIALGQEEVTEVSSDPVEIPAAYIGKTWFKGAIKEIHRITKFKFVTFEDVQLQIDWQTGSDNNGDGERWFDGQFIQNYA